MRMRNTNLSALPGSSQNCEKGQISVGPSLSSQLYLKGLVCFPLILTDWTI